jgi:solute carrier family 25 carnitine/acylcarnitine transporter 20/29
MSEIYQTKGLKGFYAGALPNIARGLLKNSYRYPLLVGLPNFYKNQLPQSIQERKALVKFMTSSSIALFESILTCPIERIKVYFMTTTEKLSYRQFFTNNQGRLFQELFRGFGPLFARQCMAWTAVLQTDLKVKTFIR